MKRFTRRTLATVHRWFGLGAAVFLFVSGLTGAIISWDHALDEWLNPRLFQVSSRGPHKPALELVAMAEAREPRMSVRYVPLAAEPGHTLMLFVEPRVNPATHTLYELDFNQLAIDPVTGAIVGRRMWGEISLDRENLLPFLYKLHYSMHVPEGWGVQLGVLFMGIVGIVWFLDCFIALAISFPNRRVWKKSFAFRFRKGGRALNFDLHRSGGVWAWLLLLVVAFTSVSMNLGHEVVRPILGLFTTLTPDPFDARTPAAETSPVTPARSYAEILGAASSIARERGVNAPPGALFHSPTYGIYGVGFFEPGNDHGDGGLGTPWLYFDSRDGRFVGDVIPGEGTAGDIFLQAQFPIHSGRIAGLFGRIIISALGLVVAMLSATGVLIWVRRRRGARARTTSPAFDDTTEVAEASPPLAATEMAD